LIRSKSRGALALLVLVFVIAAAACGEDQATSTRTVVETVEEVMEVERLVVATPTRTKRLTGTIEVDGSSTVFPVTEAVAEEFRVGNPKVQVNIGVSGTGGGFKRFAAGETEISNASRPIKDSERAAAAENGVEFIELRVAIDGLSVTVNPDNDFVDCLTVAELQVIWQPGSTIDNWSQVRAGFPDKRIRLYGPGTDSGTFDYFTEEIVGEIQASRSDYVASEDDNTLVVGINGDRNALGYFGYAYYAENPDKLKLVAIDNGFGCVTPTPATIEAGKYTPLSRPLFIYVNAAALAKPEVKAFVDFYMANAAELAEEVGYVRLSEAEYRANLTLVEAVQ
jgi:phosphate transport system substrate-binding protein